MAGADDKKAQGRRLKAARERKDLDDATAGASFLKVNRETYVQHENGHRSLKNAVDTYARGYGVPKEWLLWGENPPDWVDEQYVGLSEPDGAAYDPGDIEAAIADPSLPRPAAQPLSRLKKITREIPVMGDVAAGLWKDAVAREIHSADEWVAMDVQGYERAQLYALRVVGNSMNRFYPPGRFVVVAPAAEAGVRIGDHVIVERWKSDLVEITIKEVVNEGGRVALYPRSTDPAFQDALYLRGGAEDQAAPRIVGVVVADYGRRTRPDQGMLEPEGAD